MFLGIKMSHVNKFIRMLPCKKVICKQQNVNLRPYGAYGRPTCETTGQHVARRGFPKSYRIITP